MCSFGLLFLPSCGIRLLILLENCPSRITREYKPELKKKLLLESETKHHIKMKIIT